MSLIVADLKRFTDQNETDEKQLKKLVNRLCTPLYGELGWETANDEDEQITKLRSIIIGLMIYAENDDAIKIAIKKYTEANNDLPQLDSELRTSILVAAVRHSTKPSEVVDNLLEYHNTTSSSDLKSDICSAVSGTRDPNIGEKLLALFTDNSIIKPQDLLAWFAYMIRNRHCREITWQWMVDNWDWIESTFEDDHHYDSFARYTASTFATEEYEAKYRAFFTPKINEIGLKRTIEIGLEEIAGRKKWIENNRESVTKRLQST
jgi:aminopeptidase N